MPKKLSAMEHQQRVDLYTQGCNDRIIAEHAGTSPEAICAWRKRRQLPPHCKVDPELKQRALALHAAGKSDGEIGRALGLSRAAINNWRRQHGLAVARKVRHCGRITPERNSARLELYRKGYSDVAIARIQQVTPASVQGWRRRRNLGGNWGRYREEYVRKLSPLQARAQEAVGHGLPPDVLDDVVSDLVVAVLSGEISEEQLSLLGRKYRRSHFIRMRKHAGSASYDNVLPGHDKLRYSDVLADNSQAAWLVEMGATCPFVPR